MGLGSSYADWISSVHLVHGKHYLSAYKQKEHKYKKDKDISWLSTIHYASPLLRQVALLLMWVKRNPSRKQTSKSGAWVSPSNIPSSQPITSHFWFLFSSQLLDGATCLLSACSRGLESSRGLSWSPVFFWRDGSAVLWTLTPPSQLSWRLGEHRHAGSKAGEEILWELQTLSSQGQRWETKKPVRLLTPQLRVRIFVVWMSVSPEIHVGTWYQCDSTEGELLRSHEASAVSWMDKWD